MMIKYCYYVILFFLSSTVVGQVKRYSDIPNGIYFHQDIKEPEKLLLLYVYHDSYKISYSNEKKNKDNFVSKDIDLAALGWFENNIKLELINNIFYITFRNKKYEMSSFKK